MIGDEIVRVAPQLFPGMDVPAMEPGTLGEAGFVVGFAVCWVVRTSISGQTGAR